MNSHDQIMTAAPNSGSHASRDIVEAWYAASDITLLDPAIDCLALGYPTSRSRYRGAAAMIEDFFAEIGSIYKEWFVAVERIIDAGSELTVIGHYKARRGDEPISTFPFVHVWTINEGKLKSVICCTDVNNR